MRIKLVLFEGEIEDRVDVEAPLEEGQLVSYYGVWRVIKVGPGTAEFDQVAWLEKVRNGVPLPG